MKSYTAILIFIEGAILMVLGLMGAKLQLKPYLFYFHKAPKIFTYSLPVITALSFVFFYRCEIFTSVGTALNYLHLRSGAFLLLISSVIVFGLVAGFIFQEFVEIRNKLKLRFSILNTISVVGCFK